MMDPLRVRDDFPILKELHPNGKPLVYLDSAATSQKPQAVIDAMSSYYQTSNANVHRGIHFLGDRSTKAWHESRRKISSFFGADPEELVLTRNATEGLNLAARFLEERIAQGDVILSTLMEHHSNLVPWQELARRTGATLELIPLMPSGTLDLSWLETRIQKGGVKILALTHVSNTLGTVNPIKTVVHTVRSAKSPVTIVVDGAQAAPHMPVDFHMLGVDCYAVSAHKMLGPMGIGALLVRRSLLDTIHPVLTGGGMIDEVHIDHATFAEDLSDRFAAGTPDVAGVVGWAAGCAYLESLTMEEVYAHDQHLVDYAMTQLSKNPRVQLMGPRQDRLGSVTFTYDGVHAHDVAQILDSEGIAVRSGHHCTMPLHESMHIAASTRASFSVYSTRDEIDVLCEALKKVDHVFG